MSSEQDERLVQGIGRRRGARGMKGETGETGERGETGKPGPGLSQPVRRALVFMFVLNMLLTGGSFIWISKVVRDNKTQITRVVNTNNTQRCASLREEVAIPVPQPVAGNPSREYDAESEAIDRQRMRELHCTP